VIPRAAALLVLTAGAAQAGATYEKVVLDDMPTKRATAAAAYFRDCGSKDGDGRPLCHACFTHMSVMPDGKIDIWSDNNEYTIADAPAHPRVLIEDPLGMHSVHVLAADGAKERGKGQAGFEKYLTTLFEDSNKWCAGFGGVRHDLKNLIADAARGKYVVTQ